MTIGAWSGEKTTEADGSKEGSAPESLKPAIMGSFYLQKQKYGPANKSALDSPPEVGGLAR